ncbi:MAG: PPC domain-containing protein [Cyanobacteria bacterium J06581_3]
MRALQKLSAVCLTTSIVTGYLLSSQEVPSAFADTLINTRGSLTVGDAILDDGSLYDQYTFSGSDGQYVAISLNSNDFDPYLILLDPTGRRISENDDISRNNRNSRLVLTLPATGLYTAVANSFESGTSGQYAIKIDVANNRAAITEALAAAAVPNGTTACSVAVASMVETVESEREVSAMASHLPLNRLYETTPAVRPNGVYVALSGPAAISVMFSPQLLTQLSAQIVENCGSVGAAVFSLEADGFERTFGVLPNPSGPSSQMTNGSQAAALVDEFSCVTSDGETPLTWGTRECS